MTRWSLFLQTLSFLHHFLGLYLHGVVRQCRQAALSGVLEGSFYTAGRNRWLTCHSLVLNRIGELPEEVLDPCLGVTVFLGELVVYAEVGPRVLWISTAPWWAHFVVRGGLVCLNSAARFDKWNRAAVR